MTLPGIWQQVYIILLWATWAGSLIFPIMYAFKPWYRSEAGRHVMTFSLAVAVEFTLLIFGRLFRGTFIWPYMVFFAILLLFVAVWWRVILFIRTNRRDPD